MVEPEEYTGNRRIVVTGHRGNGAGRNENTMSAFAAAFRAGADEVETDLRVSRDGEIVLMHDLTIHRTTDGFGEVGRYTAAELAGLGSDRHRQVALYSDLLSARLGRVQAEIKEATVVDALVRMRDRGHDITTGVMYISFDQSWLVEVLAKIECATIGLLTKSASRGSVDEAVRIGARKLLIPYHATERSLVMYARQYGLEVGIFTPNEEADIEATAAKGPDSITTDRVEAAVSVLQRPA